MLIEFLIAMVPIGLLPDEIVLKLVEPELSSLQNKVRNLCPLIFFPLSLTNPLSSYFPPLLLSSQNWILDGFPRKASQAILLDQLLASHHTALNLVVYLDVPDEVIMSRIEGEFTPKPSFFSRSFWGNGLNGAHG